tara:strand:+ start:70378 stop:71568 length:1191 start_codon:yes stop_codon:yes gene_type:complete
MSKLSLTASSLALAAAAFIGLSAPALSDVVHADDTIVQGSICVGFDCVNNENFGFDTLRLKENNTRIAFTDTSSSGSFPSRDWELTANDSSNGGAEYFAIRDTTAGRRVFTVTGGAPENSIFVSSAGRVGFGTSTPTLNLHVVDGNTPALRLEQSGASGFSPQTWDLAGNEANFFIRDVTNGSKLPFRIEPGTPDATVYLDSTGNVGFGTTSPSQSLHLRRTNGSTNFLIEEASGTAAARGTLTLRNNGTNYLEIEDTSIAAGNDTGRIWNVQNSGGEFRITTLPGGANEVELSLDAGGNLRLEGGITTAGSCSVGCDAVFTEDYALPGIREHAEEMFSRGYLPNVGPTTADTPFDVSDKMGRMLNELEHAHIYIVQQQDMIDELSSRVAALESRP